MTCTLIAVKWQHWPYMTDTYDSLAFCIGNIIICHFVQTSYWKTFAGSDNRSSGMSYFDQYQKESTRPPKCQISVCQWVRYVLKTLPREYFALPLIWPYRSSPQKSQGTGNTKQHAHHLHSSIFIPIINRGSQVIREYFIHLAVLLNVAKYPFHSFVNWVVRRRWSATKTGSVIAYMDKIRRCASIVIHWRYFM